ncbi:MAG: hypothetical protein DHS20C17_14080 [Cyclobacteriaceae bacterium]|nr:MAG: hypothetical protein DHS20C17_14080 [Cyclobacteriaceae bacterium]
MMRAPFCFILLYFFILQISGQEISNINALLLNENTVRVNYDLEGEVPGQLFTVNLYSSTNQYSLPLEYVDGYVGDEVEAGINNFIDWDLSKELVAFEGELNFEVRAELTFTPISMVFPESTSITRGKQQLITWKGTNAKERVDIQLLRDGRRVQTIASTVNDGQYEWEVPYSTKPGQGYSVQISSTSSSQSDTGSEFKIHRRIPLLVKLVPFVIMTPVVIKLTEEQPQTPQFLPMPPNVPN